MGTAVVAAKKLATQINTAHRAAVSNAQKVFEYSDKSMEYAAECGRLLLRAKEGVPHGEWLPWIEANLEFEERQAQKYMRVAKNWEAIEAAKAKSEPGTYFGSINGALRLIAKPQPEPKSGEDDEPDEDEPKLKTKRQRQEEEEANRRFWEESEKATRQQWKDEGRAIQDYTAGIDQQDSAVWEWRRAWGRASNEEEKEAWLRDHPGNPLPEHLCGLSEEEGAEYDRWREQREASGERILELKSEQHLIQLKTAWDAADPAAQQKFLAHLRAILMIPEAA